MYRTLLAPSEVITYTLISKEFPRCELRTIFGVEIYEFRECLGQAFYDLLQSKKIDYSTAKEYNNATMYSEGDVVISGGVYRKSINGSTGISPENYEYWTQAPKFSEPCLERLWCLFLAEFLSWKVVFDTLPFAATKIKAEGLVKIFGATFASAGYKDYETISKAILRASERAFSNMDSYIRKNNKDGCYDLYKGLAIGCCGECGNIICDCNNCEEIQNAGYGYSFG